MVRTGLCLENIDTRMPEILAGFSRVHPGVTVNINAGDAKDLSAMLATNALDIAILTTGGGVKNLENDWLLYEQPLVWATHKNSRRDGESPLAGSCCTQRMSVARCCTRCSKTRWH